MCSTCGCSAGGKSVITNPDHIHAAGDAGATHHHEHVHPHEHDHEHHPHPHDDADTRTIRLEQDILAKNNRLAERNRGWFEGRRIRR
jgi:hydrogenase nickel incorporation protein HypB